MSLSSQVEQGVGVTPPAVIDTHLTHAPLKLYAVSYSAKKTKQHQSPT